MTPEEHETYQQAYAEAERKIAKGRKDTKKRERACRNFVKVWNYMEAPLVTSADDRTLNSIWVKSVHIQYEGTDISQLRPFFLDWECDLATLAKHYNVKYGTPSYGFVEESPAQDADRSYISLKPEIVFFRRISGDDIAAVERGIRAVYTVGARIRDILEKSDNKNIKRELSL